MALPILGFETASTFVKNSTDTVHSAVCPSGAAKPTAPKDDAIYETGLIPPLSRRRKQLPHLREARDMHRGPAIQPRYSGR